MRARILSNQCQIIPQGCGNPTAGGSGVRYTKKKKNGGRSKYGDWVQVDREALTAWSKLLKRKPRAAELLMLLVSHMGDHNAVGASQKTLAKLMTCSVDTVQRAIRELTAARFVQVVRLNGPGTTCVYVFNDQVAWGQPRAELTTSVFSATLIADFEDQVATELLECVPLRQSPPIWLKEVQALEHAPPPSEPALAREAKPKAKDSQEVQLDIEDALRNVNLTQLRVGNR
jgi:hypothetical protein